ncbi:MAG: transposase [Gammaproteobacteria bacterium]|nr:transposase [Gammaproteobacteria bacterium]
MAPLFAIISGMENAGNTLLYNNNFSAEKVSALLTSLQEKEELLQQKDQQLDQKDEKIEQLLMAIHLLRHKRFGRSSEAFNPDQLSIFDETQLDALLKPDQDEPSTTPTKPSNNQNKPKRRPLPATYPRIENIIDLTDEEDSLANKFIDGLPFYRQAKRYQAEGVDLSRQTMSGWVVQLIDPLTSILALLKQQLYQGSVLHLDDKFIWNEFKQLQLAA